MEFNFTGKKVLVTGAGQGIGRAITIALAKCGCKVYALSKTQSRLDTLAQDYPDNIIPITQDLRDWEETKLKLEEIEALDGLVNNAGVVVQYTGKALEWPREQIDDYFKNNVLSTVNCTQVIAKKMIDSGKAGSIVNISSVASQVTYTGFLGYQISKASVDMITKQFALELGPHNIRVNSVNPTLVLTESMKAAIEASGSAIDEHLRERVPMGKLPTIEEVAGPVMYLLTDNAAMVSGTTHFVDGGMVCNISTKQ